MAFLYRRPRSEFWWIRYVNPSTREEVRESTSLRHGLMTETRKARQLCAERTLAERSGVQRISEAEHWRRWVPGFFDVRYAEKFSTRTRYRAIEENFYAFFEVHGITVPRQLAREHCFNYLTWRQRSQAGLHKAKHNTVLMELKILGLVMREAIRRNYAVSNPIADMDLAKVPPKDKPALTTEQLALVSDAIDADKSPYQILLRRSFDIARYQGCRLNETWINPQTNIFEERDSDGQTRWKVRFKAKGGKLHVAPLHPRLQPMLLKLKAEGEIETFPRPVGYAGLPKTSRVWSDFLLRSNLRKQIPGISFHCLRVTVATQLARDNVPENKAMRFLGHASVSVHRAYQKLKESDLGACLASTDGLNSPVAAGPNAGPTSP